MGPKGPKSGRESPLLGLSVWEPELVSACLEEDDWKPSITFVVGTRIEDEIHTQALCLAVQVPLRKLFSVVTREDIFRQIGESGGLKGKKAKDAPLYHEGSSVSSETSNLWMDKSREAPGLVSRYITANPYHQGY